MSAVLIAAGGLVALLSAIRGRCVLVRVSGHSMRPTFHDGDLLLGVRSDRLRTGRVVVFRTPPAAGDQQGPAYRVKRLSAVAGESAPASLSSGGGGPVPPGSVLVRGDNPRAEDSRHYGYVARRDILAVVVLRLASGPTGDERKA